MLYRTAYAALLLAAGAEGAYISPTMGTTGHGRSAVHMQQGSRAYRAPAAAGPAAMSRWVRGSKQVSRVEPIVVKDSQRECSFRAESSFGAPRKLMKRHSSMVSGFGASGSPEAYRVRSCPVGQQRCYYLISMQSGQGHYTPLG